MGPRRVFYGWWIVAAGSVINAVGGGINWYGFTVFFLPLTRELGLSRAATSLIFSASRLEGGLFGPVAGWLIDRLGPRRVILAGAMLTGLGYTLMAQANAFWVILVVYVFAVSLGYNAGTYSAVSATVNAWFIRYKAVAMSFVFAANGLGGFLLVPLLAYLVTTWGWRTAMLASAIMIWAVILPAALAMHRSPESRGLHPDGRLTVRSREVRTKGDVPVDEAGGDDGAADFTTQQAVSTLSYWLLTMSIGLRMAVTTSLMVHLVPLLVWKGMSETTAAYQVSILALVSIPLLLAFGWFGVRHSKSLLSSFGAFAAAAGVVALVLLPSGVGVPLFIAALIVVNGSITSNWTILGDFFGRKRFATLLGLMGPLHSLGSFALPIFAGWVHDRTQSYTMALVPFTVLLGVAGLIFLILHRPRPQRGVPQEMRAKPARNFPVGC